MKLEIELKSTMTITSDVQKSFKDAACAFMEGTNAAKIEIKYVMKNGVLKKSKFTTTGKPSDEATKQAAILNEQLKKLITGGGKDGEAVVDFVYKI